ncbi:MAG: thiamine phosphate synthase [Blautia sp.]
MEKNNWKKQILAVTNRHLCEGGEEKFLRQIERICSHHPRALLLREKDLTEELYEVLLEKVQKICENFSVICIPHTYWKVAYEKKFNQIHVSMSVLEANPQIVELFGIVGVSVHSSEEAIHAEEIGASYITAGHVFTTQCKPGLPARGTKFLKEVCEAVEIPVYAIGGMKGNETCVKEMQECGAAGICVMSECMRWKFPLATKEKVC